jgi:hypothetical protein
MLAGLAALCVITTMLFRYEASIAVDDDTLRSMGWTRKERLLRGLTHGVAIGAVATVVVALLVVVSSRWTPVGNGRRVEPRARLAVDLPAIGYGTAASIAVACAGVAFAAWIGASHRQRRTLARRSLFGSRLALLRARPVVATGTQFGLESPRRGAAHATTIIAAALGIAIVAGVLVYTRSAQHLRDTPRLAGWSWDDFAFVENRESTELARTIAKWPEIERVGAVSVFLPRLLLGKDEVEASVFAFATEPRRIRPTTIEGRAPELPSESSSTRCLRATSA